MLTRTPYGRNIIECMGSPKLQLAGSKEQTETLTNSKELQMEVHTVPYIGHRVAEGQVSDVRWRWLGRVAKCQIPR